MRRLMKGLAGAAVLSAVGLVFAASLFLVRPGALVTSRTVGAALKHFGADWSPSWATLSVSSSVLGPRRHRYVLGATGFCVDDGKGLFSGCFSTIDLSVVVFYSRRGPVIEKIERLVVLAKTARLDLRRRQPGGAVHGLPLGLPGALREASMRIEAARFAIDSSSTALSGSFRAAYTPGEARPVTASADLLVGRGADARRLRGELTADSDLLKGGEATYVDVDGRVDLGPDGRVRTAFRARREPLRYAISGSADVELSTGPLRTLRLSACGGSAPLSPGARKPSAAAVTCRYAVVMAKPASGRFGEIRGAAGSVSLNGSLDGELYRAELKADAEPLKAWYELTGDLALRVVGRLDRPFKTALVSHEVRAALKVPRFEDLVALLRGTDYAVPAPISVLKGPLSLALNSRGDPRARRLSVSYVFASDLAGPRQRLVLRAAGDVAVENAREPGRSFEHSGELILKDVALEVPRLDIGRPPKVLVDKRIKMEEDAAPAAKPSTPRSGEPSIPLRSRLAVRTEKPLILFSNLTKEPVPAMLDLTLTYPPGAAAGKVAFQSFDVELFRRKANVDHMILALSSGAAPGKLDGLVRYKTPAVKIDILILGTTEKPRIEFTSVPPLKREDILALLIFGKNPADLDPEQAASVGNTDTALESDAFGLTSLYLFGTTPVEHVGYDSATRTASVRMRLPGGANMTLGSDFDQNRQLTLRKPLAPHWALESDVANQPGQQSMAATTFLEWFNRY